MRDRVDAGAVAKPRRFNFRKRPGIETVDGKTGGAITFDAHTTDVFQDGLAARKVGTKRLTRLLRDTRVVVTVTPELVAVIDDTPDHRRTPFGNPAQDKKGCARAASAEQRQQRVDLGFDPGRPLVPGVAGDGRFKRRDCQGFKK